MPITAALIAGGSAVLGSLISADSQSGGGGGVSTETQSGKEIAFTPVGMETGQITPFEYLMQQEVEEEQRAAYGGPLYRDKGGDIATDIFSQGIKDLMPEGILGLLLASNYLDNEDFDPKLLKPTGDPEAEIAEMLKKQGRRDTLTEEGIGLLTQALVSKIKERNTSPNIKGRGNLVPMGGRQARQDRQKETSLGITPFEYQFAAHGKPLNRSMFAQNYMPDGGDIRGPGGPRDDLIPVMASNGEYMLSKAAVDQAGGGNHARGIAALEEFNNRGNRRYG